MKSPVSGLACTLFIGLVGVLPCEAESFASSASSAGSASLGSVSDSIHDSSHSSTHKVAEGDYRVIEVTAAEGPDKLRLKLQHVAHAADDTAVIYLDVPRAAMSDRAAKPGDVVGVRQRPYGYEFAWGDTRVAFVLALADDWRRELDPRPVQL